MQSLISYKPDVAGNGRVGMQKLQELVHWKCKCCNAHRSDCNSNCKVQSSMCKCCRKWRWSALQERSNSTGTMILNQETQFRQALLQTNSKQLSPLLQHTDTDGMTMSPGPASSCAKCAPAFWLSDAGCCLAQKGFKATSSKALCCI